MRVKGLGTKSTGQGQGGKETGRRHVAGAWRGGGAAETFQYRATAEAITGWGWVQPGSTHTGPQRKHYHTPKAPASRQRCTTRLQHQGGCRGLSRLRAFACTSPKPPPPPTRCRTWRACAARLPNARRREVVLQEGVWRQFRAGQGPGGGCCGRRAGTSKGVRCGRMGGWQAAGGGKEDGEQQGRGAELCSRAEKHWLGAAGASGRGRGDWRLLC